MRGEFIMKNEEVLDARRYKKVPDILEKVLGEQEYQGCKMDFDPDASPSAIEYYKIIYKDSALKMMSEFDFEKLERRILKDKIRLLVCLSSGSDYRNNDRFGPKFKLGGDIDFNFNEKKVSKLRKLLSEKNQNKLDECSIRHHTLRNMSLIASTGRLNVLKNGLYVNNGSIAWGGPI